MAGRQAGRQPVTARSLASSPVHPPHSPLPISTGRLLRASDATDDRPTGRSERRTQQYNRRNCTVGGGAAASWREPLTPRSRPCARQQSTKRADGLYVTLRLMAARRKVRTNFMGRPAANGQVTCESWMEGCLRDRSIDRLLVNRLLDLEERKERKKRLCRQICTCAGGRPRPRNSTSSSSHALKATA